MLEVREFWIGATMAVQVPGFTLGMYKSRGARADAELQRRVDADTAKHREIAERLRERNGLAKGRP